MMPDAYTRKARLAPAVLVGIPGVALVVAGAVSPDTVLRALGLCLGALGILVAIFVRDLGRRIQPALWQSWGGPPAQARLRWTGGESAAVDRLHRRVEAVTGEPLPDQITETADPKDADRRYEDAIAVLRERTRNGDTFPLVAAENADYGFRRNTFGLRPFGIAVSLIGFVASIVFLVVGSGSSRVPQWVAATVVCAIWALFWVFVVNGEWVRKAANNYADRLLGAVDLLTSAAEAKQ